jgi:hypothetical protein
MKSEPWNKEAYIARQLAIVAKYTKVQLKPLPTAQEKAQEAWKPALETVLKTNAQANQRALERAEREQEEAQRQCQREDFARRAQLANETAVELGYYQRRWDALAERRWDPTGNWGTPNYKLNPDD